MLQHHPHKTSQTIEELKALKKDWDGRGSPKIPVRLLRTVEPILAGMEKLRLPFPIVEPKSGGGISMLWSAFNRDLLLEFLPVGVTMYTQVLRKEDNAVTYQGHFTGAEPIDRLLAWFMLEFAKEA